MLEGDGEGAGLACALAGVEEDVSAVLRHVDEGGDHQLDLAGPSCLHVVCTADLSDPQF